MDQDGLRWVGLGISRGLQVSCFGTLGCVVCRENRQNKTTRRWFYGFFILSLNYLRPASRRKAAFLPWLFLDRNKLGMAR